MTTLIGGGNCRSLRGSHFFLGGIRPAVGRSTPASGWSSALINTFQNVAPGTLKPAISAVPASKALSGGSSASDFAQLSGLRQLVLPYKEDAVGLVIGESPAPNMHCNDLAFPLRNGEPRHQATEIIMNYGFPLNEFAVAPRTNAVPWVKPASRRAESEMAARLRWSLVFSLLPHLRWIAIFGEYAGLGAGRFWPGYHKTHTIDGIRVGGFYHPTYYQFTPAARPYFAPTVQRLFLKS